MLILQIFFQIFFTLKDGWKYRNHKNFKLAWYEDMIDDLPKVIGEIADFIGYKVLAKIFNFHIRISNKIQIFHVADF